MAIRKLTRCLALEPVADESLGLVRVVGVVAPRHLGDVGLGGRLVIDDRRRSRSSRPSDSRRAWSPIGDRDARVTLAGSTASAARPRC